ncbi:AAA family ATPase [Streptomyces triticirhizae]|uniref:Kinase n=1 Tax=Streptomyces triticirhizae TaxID=2483353 RepID=A0A3M2L9F3_9ACTN|nr:ATP-binding protein [Streptomyces triticirhizae]RMI33183.1 kinase [Streptomyces triticirhizae]
MSGSAVGAAGTLLLTCGRQAAGKTTLWPAGKTTLARRLERERPALRLTADDWLRDLQPGVPDAESHVRRAAVEALQWQVATRVLRLGADVVLDWGLWSREERDRYRNEARALGARVVLCLLDPPLPELRRRLAARNAAPDRHTFVIPPEEFEHWATRFETPTPEELALFDAPPPLPSPTP